MDNKEALPTNALEQFRGAIAENGLLPPETIEADGKIHHFNSTGRRGDRKSWYVLHQGRIPHGSFGDFRTGLKISGWRADIGRRLSRGEERDFAREQKSNQLSKAESKERARDSARSIAARILRHSEPADDTHDYAVRKNIRMPDGVALLDDTIATIEYGKKTNKPFLQIATKDGRLQFGLGVEEDLETKSAEEICAAWTSSLVIPMLDEDGFQSVQLISKAGDKKFLYGAKKQGCYSVIGNMQNAEVVLIAEGFATAEEIHEATDYPVVVAYDAGNLPHVAPLIRAQYPDATIVLCADDDWQTKVVKPDGTVVSENPGLTKATQAFKAVGGVMAVPVFDNTNRGKKHTDFNDMAAISGKPAVREYFERFFKKLSIERRQDMTQNFSEEAPIFTKPANLNVAPAPNDVPEEKITAGQILDFGAAPYQFEEGNNQSFFVTVRDGGKEKTLWGIDLEEALRQAGKRKGDYAAFYNKGRARVQKNVRVFDAEGRFLHEEPRTVTKNLWHVGSYDDHAGNGQGYQPGAARAPESEPARGRVEPDPIRRAASDEARPHVSALEPKKAGPNSHFSREDFVTVQKIWKDVPHKTAYHNDSGYHLVVDEVRKVVVSKDRIELARKPHHRTDQSYVAACEHARQFWGGQMEIHGDSQHRVKAWAYASVFGVEITNFTPNDRERLEAESIMASLRKNAEPAFTRPGSRAPASQPNHGPRFN